MRTLRDLSEGEGISVVLVTRRRPNCFTSVTGSCGSGREGGGEWRRGCSLRLKSLKRIVVQSLAVSGEPGLAAFGVAVGIGALAFSGALSEGMRDGVQRIFPSDLVEVVQAGGDGGSALSLLGGRAPGLSEEDVGRVQEVPGVAAAYTSDAFRLSGQGLGGEELLQGTRYTELVGDGVPTAMVDDLTGRRWLRRSD